jgi:hypothetical protein
VRVHCPLGKLSTLRVYVLMALEVLENASFQTAFPILGSRLLNIKASMRRWRPRRKRDLFTPGYDDRFTYYTQLFALFIAIIGTIGVILSIVQTAYAVLIARDNSVQRGVNSVDMQLVQISQKLDMQFAALLNVSQEILLALEALRANGTG